MKYDIETDRFGTKHYYINNVLHREDGPAVEYSNGSKCWYKNGKLHRENGPAIEWYDGSKGWHQNGKLHREDGPTREYIDGVKHRFLNNTYYGINNKFTNKSWKTFVKTLLFS